jgi:hypothetical protein
MVLILLKFLLTTYHRESNSFLVLLKNTSLSIQTSSEEQSFVAVAELYISAKASFSRWVL